MENVEVRNNPRFLSFSFFLSSLCFLTIFVPCLFLVLCFIPSFLRSSIHPPSSSFFSSFFHFLSSPRQPPTPPPPLSHSLSLSLSFSPFYHSFVCSLFLLMLCYRSGVLYFDVVFYSLTWFQFDVEIKQVLCTSN